jgi:hypothetical protein
MVKSDESSITALLKKVEKKGAPDNVTIIDATIVNDENFGDLVVRLGSAAVSSHSDFEEKSDGSGEN